VARPHEAEPPVAALALARRLAGRRGSICVAGSFYLAAEVRAQLLAPRDDLPGSQ
jgi:folylpolyglutamate synthase/dihydropteroate synthase